MDQQTSCMASDEAYPQRQSDFFRLPAELRQIIYDLIFHSTKIAVGTVTKPGLDPRLATPGTAHPLALLRVCRRTRDDVSNQWLSQVLFRFTDTVVMYRCLNAMTTAKRSLVRQVRLLGTIGWGLFPHYPVDEYQVTGMLRMLPGLQLDTLTVLAAPKDDVGAYHVLDGLVEYSDGWRELRYISPTSEMLSGTHVQEYNKHYVREPQPRSWLNTLRRRDGDSDSDGPSVVIYRGTSEEPRAIFADSTRTAIQQSPTPEEEESGIYGMAEDETLRAAGEIHKPIMVVVRRASGVDCQQRPDDGSRPLPFRNLPFDKLLQHKNNRVQNLGDERMFDETSQ